MKTVITILIFSYLYNTVFCCTIFYYSKDESAYVGNNEDYDKKDANIWVNKGDINEYGRITFGWDNGWSQGGMNEKGLFFD